MEIRRLTPDDKPSSYYLASIAFSHGRRRTDWAEDPNQTDFVAYGVWDDAGLQAQVVILDFKVHMGPEVVLPMGGIAGVACLPASRGRGYVRAAMLRALEHMKEEGQVVSALFPFSYEFYRQVGWEWIGTERRYRVPTQVLRASPETPGCRQARPADRPSIVEVYRQFAGRYRGMVARDEKLWNKLLNDTDDHYTCTYVYEKNGRMEGYVTHRGGSGECTELNEFICLTAEARRGLLGMLRRMNMQTRHIAWSAPGDDELWYDGYDHGISTELHPVTQGRVVDIAAALTLSRPFRPVRGHFTMKVTDNAAPWNERGWHVEYDAERIEVRPARRRPQVTLDIRAFSQLFMGSASARTLAQNGLLVVDDPAAIEQMDRCFAGPPVWLNDHF